MVGKPVCEGVPEAGEQGFFELLDRVYHTGEPFVGKELPIRLNRAGRLDELFLNFVYQPIFEGDGTVSGVFVHGVDVTDQARARKEVEAAVDAVRPAAQAKNIELSVGFDPGANLVSGAPARLRQVVSNLLSNAPWPRRPEGDDPRNNE